MKKYEGDGGMSMDEIPHDLCTGEVFGSTNYEDEPYIAEKSPEITMVLEFLVPQFKNSDKTRRWISTLNVRTLIVMYDQSLKNKDDREKSLEVSNQIEELLINFKEKYERLVSKKDKRSLHLPNEIPENVMKVLLESRSAPKMAEEIVIRSGLIQ